MTNNQYRAYPAYSNSDLSAFMDWRYGNKRYGLTAKAFEVGSAVHQLVLEPHLETKVSALEAERVAGMVRALRRHPTVAWALQWGWKEQVIFRVCPSTGLPLKAKLDIRYKSSIVYDLKTTSAVSEKAFLSHFDEYGYDRQAAFYLDSIGAKRFVFVPVQKSTFQVYTVEASQELIARGRKKYQRILEEIKKVGWKPDRWNETV